MKASRARGRGSIEMTTMPETNAVAFHKRLGELVRNFERVDVVAVDPVPRPASGMALLVPYRKKTNGKNSIVVRYMPNYEQFLNRAEGDAQQKAFNVAASCLPSGTDIFRGPAAGGVVWHLLPAGVGDASDPCGNSGYLCATWPEVD